MPLFRRIHPCLKRKSFLTSLSFHFARFARVEGPVLLCDMFCLLVLVPLRTDVRERNIYIYVASANSAHTCNTHALFFFGSPSTLPRALNLLLQQGANQKSRTRIDFVRIWRFRKTHQCIFKIYTLYAKNIHSFHQSNQRTGNRGSLIG